MTTAWNNADADNDGKLNKAEYMVWGEAMNAHKTARGSWVEPIENFEEDYDTCNMISEGEGITMADFWKMVGPWMHKFQELKAADEQ